MKQIIIKTFDDFIDAVIDFPDEVLELAPKLPAKIKEQVQEDSKLNIFNLLETRIAIVFPISTRISVLTEQYQMKPDSLTINREYMMDIPKMDIVQLEDYLTSCFVSVPNIVVHNVSVEINYLSYCYSRLICSFCCSV